MNKKLKIFDNRALLGDLVFDMSTGMLNLPAARLREREVFTGVKFGKVFIKNRLTSINAEKLMSLPKSIRERIYEFPNSDYARDILAQPKGSIVVDTFPNFNNISYTSNGEAIIIHDDNGTPIRMTMF